MNNISTDYSNRASTLRSKKWQKKLDQRNQQSMYKSQGLSRDEYWKKYVKSKDDVIQFYQIYYPEYPDELVKAIAIRLEQLIEKVQTQGQSILTEEERKLLRKNVLQKSDLDDDEDQCTSTYWDPTEEINQEMLKAKIQIAEKNMEQLLLEEEKVGTKKNKR